MSDTEIYFRVPYAAFRYPLDVQGALHEAEGRQTPDSLSAQFIEDISFLNIIEAKELQIERQFFEANPEQGRVTSWVLVGTLDDPTTRDAEYRRMSSRQQLSRRSDAFSTHCFLSI